MPANYIDSGPFGIGVSFPKRPLIDNVTRRKMWELGFQKMPLMQHYLAPRTRANIWKICDFIQDYNKEHYPDADPVQLPIVTSKTASR